MKSFQAYIKSRTAHLAISYLAIVMAMSILFSLIIFTVSSNQLGRPLGPGPEKLGINRPIITDPVIKGLIEERATTGRVELFWSLFSLNIVILIGGAAFSHVLAKKTLRPIELAMESQSQFVSDASHELRTPLTALQTTNEVALRKRALSKNEIKALLSNNILEVEKLKDLTGALLGLVKYDKNGHDSTCTPLQQVVAEAMDSAINLAQQKEITVEDKVPILDVMAHKTSLTQLIRILLENAIKYSPDNSEVTLSAIKQGNDVYIEVADKGIGISESDQGKIFNRFYRADQSRSKIKADGYGLGLAIAKTICDRQGMELSVTSQLGKGSVFTVQVKSCIN